MHGWRGCGPDGRARFCDAMWRCVGRPGQDVGEVIAYRYSEAAAVFDSDRIRIGHGPYDLEVLRHMAINAMQKERSKGEVKGKFKRAGWDDDYPFRLLDLS